MTAVADGLPATGSWLQYPPCAQPNQGNVVARVERCNWRRCLQCCWELLSSCSCVLMLLCCQPSCCQLLLLLWCQLCAAAIVLNSQAGRHCALSRHTFTSSNCKARQQLLLQLQHGCYWYDGVNCWR